MKKHKYEIGERVQIGFTNKENEYEFKGTYTISDISLAYKDGPYYTLEAFPFFNFHEDTLFGVKDKLELLDG